MHCRYLSFLLNIQNIEAEFIAFTERFRRCRSLVYINHVILSSRMYN